MIKGHLIFTCFIFLCLTATAQTPPNLTADMNPGSYTAYNSGLSIAANFNAGRRFEETNKGLAANTLGNMTLPSGYSAMTLAQKTIFIVNAERACRNTVNYGSGALSVKPMYGVETHLSDVSQGHADWMMSSNTFDHCGNPAMGSSCSGGKSSMSNRIQSNATLINSWQGISENIGYSVSSGVSTFPTLNEQIIFDMMYQDAGSAWGHRVNFLQQFTDNYGAAGNEGFIGVAEKLSTPGTGYQSWAYGKVIVYNFYDPQGGATNAFTFSATLPVEMLWVKANRVNSAENSVNWKVAKEINNAFFTVERSLDGRFFAEIGTVKGAGNSEEAIEYAFMDSNAPNQTAYYRVKQTDFDDKTAYSKTVSVAGNLVSKWRVYPNPTSENYVFLQNELSENTAFYLQNTIGQVVKSGTTNGNSNVKIDLNSLPKGIYFLKMQQQIEKIVVQ